MKLSRYFWYDFKESKEEDTVISHKLSLRGGFIKMLTSGIYLWNPAGLRVLKKIEQIVREEMNKAGALECLMACIQPAELWRESGRYDDYGKEMLRIKDRHDNDMLFGPTHEEVMCFLFKSYVKSYKDLPLNLYQIQWKFRDEIRPRFGLMRGREFLMKDAYSFDINHEAAVKSYNNMYQAYYKTFKRMGLNAIAVRADTGPIGGDLSHEFQVLANSGESETFYDKKLLEYVKQDDFDPEIAKQFYAATDEMHDPKNCPISEDELGKSRVIEVGHVFNFDTKYSEPLKATIQTADNKVIPAYMGSYGIGISRLFAAIIEASHDEKGIIWPEAVAPFKYVLIASINNKSSVATEAESFYNQLIAHNYDVIYDDTDNSIGAKLAKWDLFGVPYQIIMGRQFQDHQKLEVKHRATGKVEYYTINDFMHLFK